MGTIKECKHCISSPDGPFCLEMYRTCQTDDWQIYTHKTCLRLKKFKKEKYRQKIKKILKTNWERLFFNILTYAICISYCIVMFHIIWKSLMEINK